MGARDPLPIPFPRLSMVQVTDNKHASQVSSNKQTSDARKVPPVLLKFFQTASGKHHYHNRLPTTLQAPQRGLPPGCSLFCLCSQQAYQTAKSCFKSFTLLLTYTQLLHSMFSNTNPLHLVGCWEISRFCSLLFKVRIYFMLLYQEITPEHVGSGCLTLKCHACMQLEDNNCNFIWITFSE